MKQWNLGRAQFAQIGGVTVRIGENARRCVVFFGITGPEGIEYGGTGFLVEWDEDNLTWPYLVTARHVAELLSRHESFYLRANVLNSESVPIEIAHVDWVFPSDKSVDIAVVPFGLNLSAMDHVHLPIQEHIVDFAKANAVGCGDEISIVGLFRLHHGNKRAVPFVHSGTIAVLPDYRERVPVRDRVTGKLLESEVFLVEAHTLDGLSGSPVFLHQYIAFTGCGPINRHGALPIIHGVVQFLGLYSASWDGEPGEILAKDRGFSGQIRVPIGMGVVVPGNKITDLIKDDLSLKEDRRERAEAFRAKRAAGMDSAIPPPPASEQNPKHREDFTRLLGEAARKREQED